MQVVRSKGSLKSIEDDLLKTAAKEAKGIGIGKAATLLSHSYKDRDEKKLRDKLVTKLKQKEMQKMEHFGKRIKNLGDGSDLSDLNSMEDISEAELEVI